MFGKDSFDPFADRFDLLTRSQHLGRQHADQLSGHGLTGQPDLLRPCGGHGYLGQINGGGDPQVLRSTHMLDDPVVTGLADLGRSDIARQQVQPRFARHLDTTFEPGMYRGRSS
ncbi:hypothetical protein [Nocardia jiangxiensis]|uniref:hypothetical protein n=1 Tax=Nocardia jiangxiensis TaxID=282685 RepID=UPI000688D42D|nr:hypothetical protein [Nocardia jiangxiensis]